MKIIKKILRAARPKMLAGMYRTLPLDTPSKAKRKVSSYLSANKLSGFHLGCGENRIQGWLNVDIGGAADLAWDFQKELKFLPNAAFNFAFSEHTFEHFPRPTGMRLAQEVYATLKPGGVFRVALPDLDQAIENYLSGKHKASTDSKLLALLKEEAVHRYGLSLDTRGELLDIELRGWGHSYLYNEEDISALLKLVGFKKISRVAHGESQYPNLQKLECRPPNQSSLIVEAVK